MLERPPRAPGGVQLVARLHEPALGQELVRPDPVLRRAVQLRVHRPGHSVLSGQRDAAVVGRGEARAVLTAAAGGREEAQALLDESRGVGPGIGELRLGGEELRGCG